LGYKPNPLVSALMTKVRTGRPPSDTTVLAYLSTYDKKSRFGRFLYLKQMRDGAAARAGQLGFRLEEFNLPEMNISLPRFGDILQARGIRGVLVAPLPKTGRLKMDFSPFASASIGSSLLHPDLHRAQSHTFRNFDLVLRRLRRLGYRRIGLVIDQGNENRAEHLLRALMVQYHSTLEDKTQIIPSLILPKTERSPVMKWIKRYQPKAVIGFSFEIPWWLKEVGGDQPCFVNLNWADTDGSDYGIDQQQDVLAGTAVDLVVEQLYANETGVPEHPKAVMSPGKWVVSRKPS
jgi:LacI family transcriptional regulator